MTFIISISKNWGGIWYRSDSASWLISLGYIGFVLHYQTYREVVKGWMKVGENDFKSTQM